MPLGVLFRDEGDTRAVRVRHIGYFTDVLTVCVKCKDLGRQDMNRYAVRVK